MRNDKRKISSELSSIPFLFGVLLVTWEYLLTYIWTKYDRTAFTMNCGKHRSIIFAIPVCE